MKLFKERYYYNFAGNLTRHVHFFKTVRDVCVKNGIPMKLITFLNYQNYSKQIRLVKKYKSSNFLIFFYINRNIPALIYFFFATLFSKKTIIHFKHTHPGNLVLLKKVFRNKLIFISSMEGDAISEREYLYTYSNNRNNEKIDYQKNIERLVLKERNSLQNFDFIFVQNEFFKNLLIKRHSDIESKIKISHLMSFQKGKLFHNEKLRNEYRSKLKWNDNPIITYIGNVHYPWQNLSKTIKLFKKIKAEICGEAKLLLLINKSDHKIAKGFIIKHEINEEDYYLNEVNFDEINGYLNASDLGIVLRDFHNMNKVVTSGKLLDYLGSGLPVITTSILSDISDKIKEKKYGLVLDDLDVDIIQIDEVKKLLESDNGFRKEISSWANDNFSLDSMILEYVKVLKDLQK